MKDNVVPFPGGRNPLSPPQTLEEVQKKTKIVKHIHIQNVLDAINDTLLQQIVAAGFDIKVDEEDFDKDVAFLMESLRSLLCKASDVYHPFQKLADNTFNEEEGLLAVAESIHVNFKKDDDITYKATANAVTSA